MAAFAQFGSDLDVATQRMLARGTRLVEVLKQGQYEPLAVERQVVIIYAGTNGHLDEVPEAEIGKYEAALTRFIEDSHPAIYADITEKGALDDNLTDRLDTVLKEFNATLSS